MLDAGVRLPTDILDEGPSADAVRRMHERAGHSPEEVYELSISSE